MPPLVLLAIAGVGCYAGYKLFAKLIEQAQTSAKKPPSREEAERIRREARAATGSTRNLGELEWDEKSGVYRPRSET